MFGAESWLLSRVKIPFRIAILTNKDVPHNLFYKRGGQGSTMSPVGWCTTEKADHSHTIFRDSVELGFSRLIIYTDY